MQIGCGETRIKIGTYVHLALEVEGADSLCAAHHVDLLLGYRLRLCLCLSVWSNS